MYFFLDGQGREVDAHIIPEPLKFIEQTLERPALEEDVSHIVNEGAREVGKGLHKEEVVEQHHVIEGNHVEDEVGTSKGAHQNVHLLYLDRNGHRQGEQRLQRIISGGKRILHFMAVNAEDEPVQA